MLTVQAKIRHGTDPGCFFDGRIRFFLTVVFGVFFSLKLDLVFLKGWSRAE